MKRAKHSASTPVLSIGAGALAVAIFACGGSSSNGPGAVTGGSDASTVGDAANGAPDAASGQDSAAIVAARPYQFKAPTGYDATKATPLVIMLHGYSSNGATEEFYFQFSAEADAETFLYAYPDGTLDSTAKRFWNADDACCNFDDNPVDDVAYVNAIIDDVSAKYNVDPKRIYVLGHSNGAFMAHRLACESSHRIAAIVSLAGAVWNDATKCAPSDKISVLDIHGDADATIDYNGGAVAAGAPPYPGETQTMSTWAGKNGCSGTLTTNSQTLDLDATLPGSETTEAQYSGCPSGIDVELWTIHGGSHIPNLTHPTWAMSVYGFFKAHPKP